MCRGHVPSLELKDEEIQFSKIVLFCFLNPGRYWGIVLVPVFPQVWGKEHVPYPRHGSPKCHLTCTREPGVQQQVAHLTTTSYLTIPTPSSTYSNRVSTTPLTVRGFCLGSARVLVCVASSSRVVFLIEN